MKPNITIHETWGNGNMVYCFYYPNQKIVTSIKSNNNISDPYITGRWKIKTK